MSGEFRVKPLPPVLPPQNLVIHVQADPYTVPEPTPEQVRAADAAFAHYEDHAALADMIGLYAGVMMLGDLVNEALHEPLPEAEPREQQPEDPPPAAP